MFFAQIAASVKFFFFFFFFFFGALDLTLYLVEPFISVNRNVIIRGFRILT